MGNQTNTNTGKKKTIITTICVILAAVLVVGLTVYTRLSDSGVILRSKTAAKSENYEVSGAMMAYFFSSNYQSYAQYLSMLGVDTSVSLKKQSSPYASGGTWFDYFVSMTEDYVKNILSLCEGAKADGITLDDDELAEIDSNIKSIETAANSYGYSTNQYLTALTGAGVNIKDVRKCMELSTLAQKYSTYYSDSRTYTNEQLAAYADSHPDEINGVDYYSYTVNSSDFMQKDPNGNPIGDTTTASASAYEAAQKIAEAKSEDEFITLIKSYMTETKGMEEADIETAVKNAFYRHGLAAALSTVSEWAFSAKAGDVHLEGKEGDTSFKIFYLTKPSYRDETPTRNVRHILLGSSTYEDSTKVEEIYAELEAANFSDEKFAELAAKYSEDTGSSEKGGVYNNVTIGSTVNEFNAWLFDSARKVGDHEIVESAQYGWHIMEYLGEDADMPSWKVTAKDALKQEEYKAMIDERSATIVTHPEVINDINI